MSLPEDSPIPTPPGSASGLQPGQTVGGERYLLKKVLGQGGMGVVWLAFDKRLRELVALKFLPAQIMADPAALEDLRRETLRSRKLSHPNIIRIHDFYEAKHELAFISMEYVDGPDLHVLRARRPSKVLPWTFLAPLVRQLCQALEYAHGERVLHRDLKPANLMLDGNGRLKLADFGLACVLHDSMTRISGLSRGSGTPNYMSPQQADGLKPAISDDIYSLGATLYELLSSRPPFYTGDIGYQVRNNRPPHLHERLLELELANEDIPSNVAALVMACLAKNPEQRPASARDILDWLEAAEKPQAKAAPAPAQQTRPAKPTSTPKNPPVAVKEAPPPSPPVPASIPLPPPSTSVEPLAPAPGEIAPPDKVERVMSESATMVAPSIDTESISAATPPSTSLRKPLKRPVLAIALCSVLLLGLAYAGWYWATLQTRNQKSAPSAAPGDSAQVPLVKTNTASAPTTPNVAVGKTNPLTVAEPAPSPIPATIESSFGNVAGYEKLFNGRDLAGWAPLDTPEVWSVEDGSIVGRTPSEKLTKDLFLRWMGGDVTDFELRFRFWGDLNGGVMYRANFRSPSTLSAYHARTGKGIAGHLDERLRRSSNRKLTVPGTTTVIMAADNSKKTYAVVASPEEVKAAFKAGAWNDYIIVAQSNRFIHRLNGVVITDVTDYPQSIRYHASGQLGLALPANNNPGSTLRFKDIYLKRLPPARAPAGNSASMAAKPNAHPDTTGWKDLFAPDLSNAILSPGEWLFEQGEIYAKKRESIWTRESYTNFVLDLEFKTDKGANSGVFLRSGNIRDLLSALEIQVHENTDGHNCGMVGALYGAKAPSKSVGKPAGEWNHFTITCQDSRLWLIFNGEEVLNLDLNDCKEARKNPDGTSNGFRQALKDFPRQGPIGLQGMIGKTGAAVRYRNLKIKVLD